MSDLRVAETIRAQIGRGAFVMMGAKNLIGGDDYLSWKVGRNAKRVTHVTVTLKLTDLYTVEFLRCSLKAKNPREVLEVSEGIYWDQLHAAIEAGTGMYLSL